MSHIENGNRKNKDLFTRNLLGMVWEKNLSKIKDQLLGIQRRLTLRSCWNHYETARSLGIQLQSIQSELLMYKNQFSKVYRELCELCDLYNEVVIYYNHIINSSRSLSKSL